MKVDDVAPVSTSRPIFAWIYVQTDLLGESSLAICHRSPDVDKRMLYTAIDLCWSEMIVLDESIVAWNHDGQMIDSLPKQSNQIKHYRTKWMCVQCSNWMVMLQSVNWGECWRELVDVSGSWIDTTFSRWFLIRTNSSEPCRTLESRSITRESRLNEEWQSSKEMIDLMFTMVTEATDQ